MHPGYIILVFLVQYGIRQLSLLSITAPFITAMIGAINTPDHQRAD